jgi:hypothetical protein
MGKKKTRSKYTSSGECPTISRSISNSVRQDVSDATTLLRQLKMWGKGKRTMVTIENPNKNETNKRFIRVEGNDPRAFGPWKRAIKEVGA